MLKNRSTSRRVMGFAFMYASMPDASSHPLYLLLFVTSSMRYGFVMNFSNHLKGCADDRRPTESLGTYAWEAPAYTGRDIIEGSTGCHFHSFFLALSFCPRRRATPAPDVSSAAALAPPTLGAPEVTRIARMWASMNVLSTGTSSPSACNNAAACPALFLFAGAGSPRARRWNMSSGFLSLATSLAPTSSMNLACAATSPGSTSPWRAGIAASLSPWPCTPSASCPVLALASARPSSPQAPSSSSSSHNSSSSSSADSSSSACTSAQSASSSEGSSTRSSSSASTSVPCVASPAGAIAPAPARCTDARKGGGGGGARS
mmetsp:Transcript_11602/g.33493  ORF Transcript_11602/g.33493 Transcript_11602/m.33493 type:complete len:318 (+) Transcript_11602:628-1581(+)